MSKIAILKTLAQLPYTLKMPNRVGEGENKLEAEGMHEKEHKTI